MGGLRFTSLEIPQGAYINSAMLTVYGYETTSTPISIKIYAEDVDDASAFSSTNNDLSDRPLTTASVDWDLLKTLVSE